MGPVGSLETSVSKCKAGCTCRQEELILCPLVSPRVNLKVVHSDQYINTNNNYILCNFLSVPVSIQRTLTLTNYNRVENTLPRNTKLCHSVHCSSESTQTWPHIIQMNVNFAKHLPQSLRSGLLPLVLKLKFCNYTSISFHVRVISRIIILDLMTPGHKSKLSALGTSLLCTNARKPKVRAKQVRRKIREICNNF